MSQAVSCRSVPSQKQFRSQVSPGELCGGQSGSETFLPQVPLPYPAGIIPPMLHIHPLISDATSTQTDSLTERRVNCEKCGWWGHFWDPRTGAEILTTKYCVHYAIRNSI